MTPLLLSAQVGGEKVKNYRAFCLIEYKWQNDKAVDPCQSCDAKPGIFGCYC